jgi:hypothetical protein
LDAVPTILNEENFQGLQEGATVQVLTQVPGIMDGAQEYLENLKQDFFESYVIHRINGQTVVAHPLHHTSNYGLFALGPVENFTSITPSPGEKSIICNYRTHSVELNPDQFPILEELGLTKVRVHLVRHIKACDLHGDEIENLRTWPEGGFVIGKLTSHEFVVEHTDPAIAERIKDAIEAQPPC